MELDEEPDFIAKKIWKYVYVDSLEITMKDNGMGELSKHIEPTSISFGINDFFLDYSHKEDGICFIHTDVELDLDLVMEV